MTIPWKITPIWGGLTVAVLASGPSMNQAVADQLRKHKCIVVNHTYRLAPWADMMVALDANLPLWDGAKDFRGMRVCGVDCDKIDALYAGQMHERVKLGPVHTIEILNSGLAAIRIAAAMGVGRIILAGFDPDRAPTGKYVGLAQGLDALIAELRASGVSVERFVPAADVPPGAALKAKPVRARRQRWGAA